MCHIGGCFIDMSPCAGAAHQRGPAFLFARCIGLFDLTEIVSAPTRRGSLTTGQDLPRRRPQGNHDRKAEPRHLSKGGVLF